MDRLRLIGCARLFGTFTSQPHAKRIDVPRLWVHQGGFNVAMAKPVASITVRLRSSLHEIIRCLSTNHHHKGAGRGDHMVDTAWQSAAPRACKGNAHRAWRSSVIVDRLPSARKRTAIAASGASGQEGRLVTECESGSTLIPSTWSLTDVRLESDGAWSSRPKALLDLDLSIGSRKDTRRRACPRWSCTRGVARSCTPRARRRRSGEARTDSPVETRASLLGHLGPQLENVVSRVI